MSRNSSKPHSGSIFQKESHRARTRSRKASRMNPQAFYSHGSVEAHSRSSNNDSSLPLNAENLVLTSRPITLLPPRRTEQTVGHKHSRHPRHPEISRRSAGRPFQVQRLRSGRRNLRTDRHVGGRSLELRPEDGPSNFHLKRIQKLKSHSPSDWVGEVDLAEK